MNCFYYTEKMKISFFSWKRWKGTVKSDKRAVFQKETIQESSSKKYILLHTMNEIHNKL